MSEKQRWLILFQVGILFGIIACISIVITYLGLNFKQQFFLFFGLLLLWFGFNNFRKLNLIKNTPTSKIQTASSNVDFTEIKAIAWPLIHIKSILGEPLVYYNLTLEQYVERGEESTWKNIGSFNSFHDHLPKSNNGSIALFLALDDTGVAQVNISVLGNQFYDQMSKRTSIVINNRKDVLQILDNAKEMIPASKLINLAESKYRFVEEKIVVGSPLYFLASLYQGKQNELKCFGDSSKMIDLIQENDIYKKLNLESYTTKKILSETIELAKECDLEGCYDLKVRMVIDAFKDQSQMKEGGAKEIVFAPLLEHEILKNNDWFRSVVLLFLLAIGCLIYFIYTLS